MFEKLSLMSTLLTLRVEFKIAVRWRRFDHDFYQNCLSRDLQARSTDLLEKKISRIDLRKNR